MRVEGLTAGLCEHDCLLSLAKAVKLLHHSADMMMPACQCTLLLLTVTEQCSGDAVSWHGHIEWHNKPPATSLGPVLLMPMRQVEHYKKAIVPNAIYMPDTLRSSCESALGEHPGRCAVSAVLTS